MSTNHYDAIIVGSGFGGSVSALRLSEKGYRVLVLEKGRRFSAADFPKTNWDLRNFMWVPELGLRGPFKMSLFEHLTVLHGVGVGGGSLVYGNTLPVPQEAFFRTGSWADAADWQAELAPHYATAKRMLGAVRNPVLTRTDDVLRAVAEETGRGDRWQPNDVGIYFGEPGRTVPDPFFGGEGPPRTGCIRCGGCFTGCRHGAKNTLDKNYLWLAERRGAIILAETEVTAVRPRLGGYAVEVRPSVGRRGRPQTFTAEKVVLSGGVLGTNELLLRMRDERDGLPDLSPRVGDQIRTNSEALIGVVSGARDLDLSDGIAISSIVHTDAHSHLEPCRYGGGSGLFRFLVLPHAPGRTAVSRLAGALGQWIRHPVAHARAVTTPDWARGSVILLYMRTADGTLRFVRGRNPGSAFRDGLRTARAEGQPPTASLPEATDLARRYAAKIDGVVMSLFTETLLDIPTTAHVLGGACIGEDASGGVIDARHEVFGYPGLYVCDGSAVSSNPGVNPSLTITAMTERAMSFLPPRGTA